MLMDIIRILQVTAVCLGVRELWNAVGYLKRQKTRRAVRALCIGVFACACGVFSLIVV